ncbi:DUF6731 family protein [Lactiplantibacillus plantarum]|uniref:DUF6731 family protein n=1 Tax=Lactiplantibacillus plantarum TaxID=1590 RepID=UPI00053532C4|nr:DUF6731 family protein [Lactiplantibacillus plantarum]AMR18662.1 hypothetical protein AZF39_00659 [Lactiplantibacillus plantarum]AQX94098.1 hypothetical protein LC611_10340 [Lactiplantibacillus plantarum]AWL17143.1 hypothetical protein DHT46_13685 [Lactiplantibacillus plantarum]AYA81204.1 hypothetical protein DWG19_12625 [Lactiplantibacillus plantarum]AYC67679.1 hypothetical protein D5291_00955 [Lactiplantibacillus plantarum]
MANSSKVVRSAVKKIRFNYFSPYLIDSENENAVVRWNMKELIEFFINHNHSELNTAVPLGDEIADMEWNTAHYDDKNDIYYFQLSKNRSKDIPSKKKLNHDKIPLDLDDDEYIGEFNLLVYDAKYGLLMIQSNYYGLSTNQIQTALAILRQRVKDALGESEKDNPKGVNLEPLIDSSMISQVKKHKIYRRISVKGSDFSFAAADDFKDNPINKAITELKKISGVSFNIELSMAREPKGKSLKREPVRELMDEVMSLYEKDTDVSMNVTSRAEEDAALDFVNLIEPRLTSSIVMSVENRTTIASEAMYTNFCEQNYLTPGESNQNMRDKASLISGATSNS